MCWRPWTRVPSVSGMPILDVDKAKSVIVIKRSVGHGYAGIDHEFYTGPGTARLLSDAKAGLTNLLAPCTRTPPDRLVRAGRSRSGADDRQGDRPARYMSEDPGHAAMPMVTWG